MRWSFVAVALLVGGCSHRNFCASGVPNLHRPAALECAGNRTQPAIPEPIDAASQCRAQSDCHGQNARCLPGGVGASGDPVMRCVVDECVRDDDCGAGKLCQCDQIVGVSAVAPTNICVQAACRQDSDCSCGYCSPDNASRCGRGSDTFFCRTVDDECFGNNDCGTGQACHFDEVAKHWRCLEPTICNG